MPSLLQPGTVRLEEQLAALEALQKEVNARHLLAVCYTVSVHLLVLQVQTRWRTSDDFGRIDIVVAELLRKGSPAEALIYLDRVRLVLAMPTRPLPACSCLACAALHVVRSPLLMQVRQLFDKIHAKLRSSVDEPAAEANGSTTGRLASTSKVIMRAQSLATSAMQHSGWAVMLAESVRGCQGTLTRHCCQSEVLSLAKAQRCDAAQQVGSRVWLHVHPSAAGVVTARSDTSPMMSCLPARSNRMGAAHP